MYISYVFALTNRDDLIANSFSIITANGSVVDVLDAVHGSVVGLPPSSLSTIGKIRRLFQMTPAISKQSKQPLTLRPQYQQHILRLRLLLLLLWRLTKAAHTIKLK